MKKRGLTASLFLIILLGLLSVNFGFASDANGKAIKKDLGHIVIANRASGTISVIDVRTDKVSATITLPNAINPPEPMYVVHSPRAHRVFVGDRANNRVVVFNADTFEYETSVPTGRGVFHMWADPHDASTTTSTTHPQSSIR